jgi:hypothetical protein
MSRIFRDSSVLNQLGSPSINSNTYANRPTFGQVGRLFVSTDTLAIFRDTGTAWDNLTNNPGNIGTLQEVTTNGNTTNLNISIIARESLFTKTFDSSDIGGDSSAILNIGSYVNLSNAVLGIQNINSSSLKTLTANITFEADSDISNISIKSEFQNLSLSAKTITVTQGTFVNAVSNFSIYNVFNNTSLLTISHYSSIIVRPLTMTNATITNYYGLLLNDTTGSTITNRWGVYQIGGNDNNYFAGKVLIGTSTSDSNSLKVVGNAQIDGTFQANGFSFLRQYNNIENYLGGKLSVGTTTTPIRTLLVNGEQEWTVTVGTGTHTTSGNHLPVWVNGVQYWLALLNPPILP